MKIKLHFMTNYSNAENQPIPMGSHIFSWHYICSCYPILLRNLNYLNMGPCNRDVYVIEMHECLHDGTHRNSTCVKFGPSSGNQ